MLHTWIKNRPTLPWNIQTLWRLRQNGCHSGNSKTEWYIILVSFCWFFTELITVWMPFYCFQIIKEQKTDLHQYNVPFCPSQLCHCGNCESRMASILCTILSFPTWSRGSICFLFIWVFIWWYYSAHFWVSEAVLQDGQVTRLKMLVNSVAQ